MNSNSKSVFGAYKPFALVLFTAFFLFYAQAAQKTETGLQSTFYEANNFYAKGLYKEAADLYLQLVEEGYQSGNLFYNLGNTYFKMGQKGMAILFYEKARRHMPGDADLKSNLSYALSGVEDGKRDWKSEFLFTLINIAPLEQQILLTAFWFMVSTGLLIFFILFPGQARNGKLKHWWTGVFTTSLILFLLTGAVTLLTIVDRSVPDAVAVNAGGQVRFEPNDKSTLYYNLPEGAVVKMLEKKNGWVMIRRKDGKRGWVEEKYLQKI